MNETAPQGQKDSHLAALRRRIAAYRVLAMLALFLERLWLAALPLASIACLYLIVSWFGLLRLMPDMPRMALVAVFALAGIASLLSFRGFRLPRRDEAEARIEERSGLSHQAIRVLHDRQSSRDAVGDVLWKAHQSRMASRIGALDVGLPSPDIARHDPLALRAVLAGLLFVAFFHAGSPSGGSVWDGFVGADMARSGLAGARIDAWVTPPGYTGRAPVYLKQEEPEKRAEINVPQFSKLTVRISGEAAAPEYIVMKDGAHVPLESADGVAEPADQAVGAPTSRSFELELTDDGTMVLAGKAFRFSLTPDAAPTIDFAKEPSATIRGALEVSFVASDDYAVTEAHAEIVPIDAEPAAVSLYDLPEYRLDIPASGKREIKATASRDLTESPLSGKKVRLTLVATDATGRTGRSASRDIILPKRPFSLPLAASIAEQRQVFSLDARRVPRALELNEASTLRPEETVPKLAHYLLVQSAANRLKLARDAAMLKETADYFWSVALGMEDGDLSQAEKRLRDAQQALADALKRNAPDSEVKQLMDELRKAMGAYLNELARRNQENGQPQTSQMASKVLRSQDLEKMLDQLENLARSGAREEAQKLLNDMQRMMNNLNTARPDKGQDQRDNPVREQIDKLGQIIQEQEKLMQETHRLEQALRDREQSGDSEDGLPPEADPFGQEGLADPGDQGAEPKPDGQAGEQDKAPGKDMTADELKQALKDLRKRQEAFEKGMGELQNKLSELGVKPVPGFGEGKKQMKNAAGALGKPDGQAAVEGQGKALEALRKGAGEMMKQMQARGKGPGMGQPGGQNQAGRDPLGRQSGETGGDADDSVKVPEEIDIQRAREILEAIRKKLSDGASGTVERNYLERLLDLGQ
jgi:uncharacterized protein (TIGR02302 family)